MDIKEYAVLMANRFDRGDEKWVKYYEKKTLCVKELPNGDVVAFEKPHVETRFCYSYDEVADCRGHLDTMGRASRLCNSVKSDYDMFLEENIKWLKRDLEQVERNPIYLKRLFGMDVNPNVVDFSGYQNGPTNNWVASPEDIAVIKSGIEEQIAYLTKQCATYWKRFGGSKLKTWTYSIND